MQYNKANNNIIVQVQNIFFRGGGGECPILPTPRATMNIHRLKTKTPSTKTTNTNRRNPKNNLQNKFFLEISYIVFKLLLYIILIENIIIV